MSDSVRLSAHVRPFRVARPNVNAREDRQAEIISMAAAVGTRPRLGGSGVVAERLASEVGRRLREGD
jgi:hypothetical protein